MLLSYHNPIYYKASTVDKNSPKILMTDIFRNYKKYFDLVAKDFNLITYFIKDSPRPEALSYKLYNNTQYYWVLLMANDIYDPFHGWIKTQNAVYESISQEYTDPEDLIAYHVDSKGSKYFNLVQDPNNYENWYDKGDINRQYVQYIGALAPISIYEQAILENEAKRKIRIVQPTDINNFVKAFTKEMEKNI